MTTKEKKEFVFEIISKLEANRTNCHDVADIFKKDNKEDMSIRLINQAIGIGSAIVDVLEVAGVSKDEYIEYKMKQHN